MEEWKGCLCLRLWMVKSSLRAAPYFPSHLSTSQNSVEVAHYFSSGRRVSHGACCMEGKDGKVLCSHSAPFSVCLPSCLLILNEHCIGSVIPHYFAFFYIILFFWSVVLWLEVPVSCILEMRFSENILYEVIVIFTWDISFLLYLCCLEDEIQIHKSGRLTPKSTSG